MIKGELSGGRVLWYPMNGRKGKRDSSDEILESKKIKAEETTADLAALTPEIVGNLQVQGDGGK